MRPIRIDWYAPPRAWSRLQIIFVLACVVVGVLAGLHLQLSRRILALDQDIALLTGKLGVAQSEAAAAGASGAARLDQTGLARAARLLGQDLNPVFTTLETVETPGVRLLGLTLDAGSGDVRVEYSLDAFAHVSALHDALNGSGLRDRWQLERVALAGRQEPGMAPANAVAAWRMNMGGH